MGWIVVLIIVFIIIVIWLSQKKQPARKSSSQPTITGVRRRKDIESEEPAGLAPPNVPVSSTPKHIAHGYKQEGRQRTSKEASTYGGGGEVTKTYVSQDWETLWKEAEARKSPFLDELSPAQPYLRKAYEMEKEGADQEKIQEVLKEAYHLDERATDFYRGHMSIIRRYGAKVIRIENNPNEEDTTIHDP